MTRSFIPFVSFLAALLATGCFDLALPDKADTGTIECDGGRYDQGTGLCWQDPKDGQFGWQEAIDYCDALDRGGHSDWRLPSVDEFVALLDNCDVDLANGSGGMCDSCAGSASCNALFCPEHDDEWSA
ncbi:MAG TPA: DUF1566 domain-containing protein, partial [Polyangia bacterium]|nr:DUF1566 domain-containing protein [Polyangia bacterium]